MTTSSDPRGRATEFYSAVQSALATAASTGFVRRQYYDWDPQPQSEPQDDPVLGGAFHNTIDETPAAPDLEGGSLRIVHVFDLIQVGDLLKELLGAPTTTGTGTFTHTFTSAGLTVPSSTFERRLASGQFDGAIGAVCRSVQFPIGAERGFGRLPASYFARELVDQYGASIAGSPTARTLANRVPRAIGTIKRDGSALGSILSGDLMIENQLGEDRYHGDRLVSDVQLEGRRVAINLTGRFKGAALRDLGKIASGAYLQGTQSIELEWQLSASMKLTLTIANVRFAKTGVPARGPGRMDVALRGRAEVGASGAMVTAVLVNSQASY